MWCKQKSIPSYPCLSRCITCTFCWIWYFCTSREDKLSRGTMAYRMCTCHDTSICSMVACLPFRSCRIPWRYHGFRHSVTCLDFALCNLHSKTVYNYKSKSLLRKGIRKWIKLWNELLDFILTRMKFNYCDYSIANSWKLFKISELWLRRGNIIPVPIRFDFVFITKWFVSFV